MPKTLGEKLAELDPERRARIDAEAERLVTTYNKRRAYYQERYARDKEAHNARSIAWQNANRERVNANARARRARNAEAERAKARDRLKSKPGYAAAHTRKWREANGVAYYTASEIQQIIENAKREAIEEFIAQMSKGETK